MPFPHPISPSLTRILAKRSARIIITDSEGVGVGWSVEKGELKSVIAKGTETDKEIDKRVYVFVQGMSKQYNGPNYYLSTSI